ncbi:MAG: hypothetical protein QXL94_00160 [Candidatus Parvarchaeum sp.]
MEREEFRKRFEVYSNFGASPVSISLRCIDGFITVENYEFVKNEPDEDEYVVFKIYDWWFARFRLKDIERLW